LTILNNAAEIAYLGMIGPIAILTILALLFGARKAWSEMRRLRSARDEPNVLLQWQDELGLDFQKESICPHPGQTRSPNSCFRCRVSARRALSSGLRLLSEAGSARRLRLLKAEIIPAIKHRSTKGPITKRRIRRIRFILPQLPHARYDTLLSLIVSTQSCANDQPA